MTIELMRFSRGGSRLIFTMRSIREVASRNPLPQSCGPVVGQSTTRVSRTTHRTRYYVNNWHSFWLVDDPGLMHDGANRDAQYCQFYQVTHHDHGDAQCWERARWVYTYRRFSRSKRK